MNNSYLSYAEDVWESIVSPGEDGPPDGAYILSGIFAVLMYIALKDQA
jgi:hypothetical protein